MPRTTPRRKQATQVDAVSRLFAQRLSDARVEQGMSMPALAAALGRTAEELERWESGRVPLTMTMLANWVRALGLNVVLLPGISDHANPAPRALHVSLKRGRPLAASPRSLPLMTAEQVEQLRRGPVPHTGNKLLTALKLSDSTIADLSRAATLRYVRLANWVGGRVRRVPPAYAVHLATCFGCEPHDLFPETRPVTTLRSEIAEPVRRHHAVARKASLERALAMKRSPEETSEAQNALARLTTARK